MTKQYDASSRRIATAPRASAAAALRSAAPPSVPETPMNDAAPNTNLAVTPKTSRDDATARQSFAETEGLV